MTESAALSPPDKTGENETKRPKSKGEKLFDRITYAGIAGIGTFVVTVPVAYELEHHLALKPKFEKTVAAVEKLFARLPIKLSHDKARKAVKTTTLMQGGNLMLLPVWGAEHFKVPIVRGLNAMTGDKIPDEKVEEAPQQTAGSLVKSRLVAWLMVFGSLTGVEYLYPKALPAFIEETGKNVCKFFRRPEQQLNAGKMLEDTRTFGYGKIAALDVFATAASATLLYVGGHFFARKQEERHERKLAARETHGTVSSETVASPSELAENATGVVPALQVRGEKLHAGKTQDRTLATQIYT